jgi:site-specific DNA-methyltransferase (adenine-specific)
MRKLPNNFVDLTVTSPPYDNLRTYNGFAWDFESTAKELYRITKDGGVVVWVVGDATINGSETGTSFHQALYFKQIGFNLHDTMIYAKHKPPLTHNRYEQCFEYMFVLSKGKPKTFNPILIDKKYMDKRKSKAFGRNKTNEHDIGYSSEKTKRIMDNIWWYVVSGGNATKDKCAHKHPAVFPEQLANDHIVSWSNPGDLVFDPFLGSGTTAKMAVVNGRNFLGFDISEEYCKLAKSRVNQYIIEHNLQDSYNEIA